MSTLRTTAASMPWPHEPCVWLSATASPTPPPLSAPTAAAANPVWMTRRRDIPFPQSHPSCFVIAAFLVFGLHRILAINNSRALRFFRIPVQEAQSDADPLQFPLQNAHDASTK